MIFTLVFVTIETIEPEPALASGEFSCLTSSGKAYIYQSKWVSSGSGTLEIYRRDPEDSSQSSNSPDLIKSFPASVFQNHGSISEINSLSMDQDGNMYAVYKTTGSAGYLYKLNYTSSGNGTADYLGYVGSSDYNAASYYERTVSGQTYKYLIIGRGFLDGDARAIRLNSAGTSIEQNIDITITGGEDHRKAKDFAWITDGAHPAGVDLIAYNRDASELLGGTISHGGTAGGTETMTIATQVRATGVTGFSGSKDSGSAMYFGDGITYFMNNNNGRLWKYDAGSDTSTSLNSGEWSSTNFYMESSSNTDGAACGLGSTTVAAGSVSATTSLNSELDLNFLTNELPTKPLLPSIKTFM